MAMSALKVTPAKLSSKATEFSEDAKTMKGITHQMFQIIKQLNGDVWSGAAEKAYADRFRQLENDCDMLVKMIREFSDDLKEIADEYSKAEKANEETARSLKVNVIGYIVYDNDSMRFWGIFLDKRKERECRVGSLA